jgi:feruloyl esterase
VAGAIRPTPASDIGFEVWLPAASEWNERYLQVGNGGLAGSMSLPHYSMVGALLRGAATAGTDDGHISASAFLADWIPGQPEKLVDFGHRAVHLTAVIGQALVQEYYGQAPQFRYFSGCSGGGRESLMEAQRYPDDFDGYLVGAPGTDIPNTFIEALYIRRALATLPAAEQLGPQELRLVSDAARAQCDLLDGVEDGVLDDPRRCDFDVGALVCSDETDGECLTAAQAEVVKTIHAGLTDPANGELLTPGQRATMGAEDYTWPVILLDDAQGFSLFGAAASAVPALVWQDLGMSVDEVDPVRAVRYAREHLGPIINPSPDLEAARRRGAKILHFHGWVDPNIPAQHSLDYFEAVQRHSGGDVTDYYRLFMAPGMAHCAGGRGPTAFGGFNFRHVNENGFAGELGAPGTAQHDVLTALEQWVERGTAPDTLIASEFAVDLATSFTLPPRTAVTRTRLLCPYPQVARHQGGSVGDAASFRCEAR